MTNVRLSVIILCSVAGLVLLIAIILFFYYLLNQTTTNSTSTFASTMISSLSSSSLIDRYENLNGNFGTTICECCFYCLYGYPPLTPETLPNGQHLDTDSSSISVSSANVHQSGSHHHPNQQFPQRNTQYHLQNSTFYSRRSDTNIAIQNSSNGEEFSFRILHEMLAKEILGDMNNRRKQKEDTEEPLIVL